jgi:hypothetical protein
VTDPVPPAEPGPNLGLADTAFELSGGDSLAIKRKKTPIILAGAAAMALVVSIGVFVAYRLVFGGPQPAERMPASVVAFASLDLTPGLDQTRKLNNLAQKMPETSGVKDPKAALEKALEGLDLKGVDVKRDVMAWLGNRLALGAWTDSHHDVYGLLAMESTDDKAAFTGLNRIKGAASGKIGFAVHDGFALAAFATAGSKDVQAAADAAWAEAAASPLAKSAKYTEARKWLDGDQVAVLFADYDGIAKIAESLAPNDLGGFQTGMPSGRMILGVRAENDGLSAHFHTFGGKAKTPTEGALKNAVGRLGDLPAGTSLGVIARLPKDFASGPLMLLGLPFASAVPGGDLPPPDVALTPQEQKEFDSLMEKVATGKITAAEQKRLDELSEKMFPMNPGKALTPAERKELEALLSKGDLTEAEAKRVNELIGVPEAPAGATALQDVFGALGGGLVTLSAADITTSPVFRMVIELARTPDAETTKRLTDLPGKDFTVKLEGSTLTVQSNGFSASGRLADDALFKRATANAPGNDAQVAIYADLTRIASAQLRSKLGPYQAIFVMTGDDGGMARVLIG